MPIITAKTISFGQVRLMPPNSFCKNFFIFILYMVNAKIPHEGGVFFEDESVLFDAFADSSEGFWIVDGEFGKNFAVEFDTFGLHPVNQSAVVETILVCSVVDAGDPETAEIAFAIAAVTVSVAERLDNTLLRETIAASAIVLHAFSGF